MLVGAPLLIFSLLVSGGSVMLDAYSNTRLTFWWCGALEVVSAEGL
jgi:hypothetical protein